jgi:hypothetical protein
MKKQLAFLFFSLLNVLGFAQDKSFDLSKYKFPDYKRHELEFKFMSYGYGDKQIDHSVHSDVNGNPLSSSETSYFATNCSSNIGYQYDYLTRKRVDYLFSNFSGGYYYTKNNSYGDITRQYSPSVNFNINGSRRYYQNENKLFFEGLADLSYNYNKSKTTYSDLDNDYIYSQNYLDMSAGLGIGYGRKEKVSDLWQAYYILSKLKGQNSLDRDLNNNDIYEFATLASKLKNKRFFDYRLRSIAELQALDSLMHKQGLVKNTDIAYFTTLNDYWSYGSFPDRESGNVVRFWITPEYTKKYSNSSSSGSQASEKSSVISNLSFSHSKQLNLLWERNFYVLLWDEVILDRSGNYFDAYRKNTFSYKASYGYSFFPDSRTSISGNIAITGITVDGSGTYSEIVKWQNSVQANFSAVYYISPRLQLTGNAGFAYYKDYFVYDKKTTFNYNLGLRYAIF